MDPERMATARRLLDELQEAGAWLHPHEGDIIITAEGVQTPPRFLTVFSGEGLSPVLLASLQAYSVELMEVLPPVFVGPLALELESWPVQGGDQDEEC